MGVSVWSSAGAGGWMVWTAVGLVGVAVVLGVVWVWGDRARGRVRCSKCWYDMAGAPAPGLKCPECGREHRSQRALKKTRRRGWALSMAGVMVAGSAGLCVGWVAVDVTRVRVLPTWALVDLIRARKVVGWRVADEAVGELQYPRRERAVSVRQLAVVVDAWIDAAYLPPRLSDWETDYLIDSIAGRNEQMILVADGPVPPISDQHLSRVHLMGKETPWLAPRLADLVAQDEGSLVRVGSRAAAASMLARMSWTSSEAARLLVDDIVREARQACYAANAAMTDGGPHLIPELAKAVSDSPPETLSALWSALERHAERLKDDLESKERWYTTEVRRSIAQVAAGRHFSYQAISLLVTLGIPAGELPSLMPALVRCNLGKSGTEIAFTEADERVRSLLMSAAAETVEVVAQEAKDQDRYVRYRAATLLRDWAKEGRSVGGACAARVLTVLVAGCADAESSVAFACEQGVDAMLMRADVAEVLAGDPAAAGVVGDAVVSAVQKCATREKAGRLIRLGRVGARLGEDGRARVRGELMKVAEGAEAWVRGLARQAAGECGGK